MNLLKPPAQTRKLLTALSLIAIATCLLVLLPPIRAALIAFGETLIHRPLNAERWQQMLVSMAFAGLFVSCALLFIISKWFEIIPDIFPPEKRGLYYTIIEFGLRVRAKIS